MSALAKLWTKWILDETKSHSIDMVPEHWKEEVQELLEKEKVEEV